MAKHRNVVTRTNYWNSLDAHVILWNVCQRESVASSAAKRRWDIVSGSVIDTQVLVQPEIARQRDAS